MILLAIGFKTLTSIMFYKDIEIVIFRGIK